MRQLVKRYKCGCVSLFCCTHYLHRGKVCGMGFRVWRCGQCKIADKIINEILAEERGEI